MEFIHYILLYSNKTEYKSKTVLLPTMHNDLS